MSTHEITNEKSVLGMWLYIMSDCVLFAALFATYIVLSNSTFGGPSIQDITTLPYALIEALVLLTSSLTCAFAVEASRQNKKQQTLFALLATLILGLVFIGMEAHEFFSIFKDGYSWHTSAFLSSFFTLVGTHGLHITIGLVWLCILIVSIVYRGLHVSSKRKLELFSLFWHFLDIVWICIFTFVYLFGAL